MDIDNAEKQQLNESWQSFLQTNGIIPSSKETAPQSRGTARSSVNNSSSTAASKTAGTETVADSSFTPVTKERRQSVQSSRQTARYLAGHQTRGAAQTQLQTEKQQVALGATSFNSFKVVLNSAFMAAKRVFMDLAICPVIDESEIAADMQQRAIRNSEDDYELDSSERDIDINQQRKQQLLSDLRKNNEQLEHWNQEKERLDADLQALVRGDDELFSGPSKATDNNNVSIEERTEQMEANLNDAEEQCQYYRTTINEIRNKLAAFNATSSFGLAGKNTAEGKGLSQGDNSKNDNFNDLTASSRLKIGRKIEKLPLGERKSYLLKYTVAEFFSRLGYIDVESPKDRSTIENIVVVILSPAEGNRVFLPEALSFIVTSNLYSFRAHPEYEKFCEYASEQYGTHNFLSQESTLQILEVNKRVHKKGLYSEIGGERQNIRKRRLISKQILTEEEKCTFKPTIITSDDETFVKMMKSIKDENARRILCQGVESRARESIFTSTVKRTKRAQDKVERLREELELKNTKECKYQPQLVGTLSSKMNTNSYTVGRRNSQGFGVNNNSNLNGSDFALDQRSMDVTQCSSLPIYMVNNHKEAEPGLPRHEYLYKLATGKEINQNSYEPTREEREFKECTFEPDILKSAKMVTCRSHYGPTAITSSSGIGLSTISDPNTKPIEEPNIKENVVLENKLIKKIAKTRINSFDEATMRMRIAREKREEEKKAFENLGKPKYNKWQTSVQLQKAASALQQSDGDKHNNMNSSSKSLTQDGTYNNIRSPSIEHNPVADFIPSPIQNANKKLEEKALAVTVPLLFIDIVVAPGKTGRIGVHEGDCVTMLAQNFAKIYSLNASLYEIVKRVITDNIKAYIPNKVVMVGDEMYIGEYRKKKQNRVTNSMSGDLTLNLQQTTTTECSKGEEENNYGNNIINAGNSNEYELHRYNGENKHCYEGKEEEKAPINNDNDSDINIDNHDDIEQPMELTEQPIPSRNDKNTDILFYDEQDLIDNDYNQVDNNQRKIATIDNTRITTQQQQIQNNDSNINEDDQYEYTYEEVDQYVYEDEDGNIVDVVKREN